MKAVSQNVILKVKSWKHKFYSRSQKLWAKSWSCIIRLSKSDSRVVSRRIWSKIVIFFSVYSKSGRQEWVRFLNYGFIWNSFQLEIKLLSNERRKFWSRAFRCINEKVKFKSRSCKFLLQSSPPFFTPRKIINVKFVNSLKVTQLFIQLCQPPRSAIQKNFQLKLDDTANTISSSEF